MRKQPPNTTNDQNKMNFDEWLQHGYKQGWCGPPVCETHDALPTTIFEDEQFEQGSDPCIHIVRLYEDLETKQSIEANHSPSSWRAHNLGWEQ